VVLFRDNPPIINNEFYFY